MKVPLITTASLIFSVLLSLFFPLILLIILRLKNKLKLKPFFLGFAVLTLASVLQKIPGFFSLQTSLISIISVMCLGVLIEELFRYFIFLKKLSSSDIYKNAYSYGLGAGFALSFISFFLGLMLQAVVFAVFINSGEIAVLKASTPTREYIHMLNLLYYQPLYFFVGGLGSFLYLFIQNTFSLLTAFSVKSKKYRYFYFSLFLHLLFGFLLLISSNYLISGLISVFFGVLSLYFLFLSKKLFSDKNVVVKQD